MYIIVALNSIAPICIITHSVSVCNPAFCAPCCIMIYPGAQRSSGFMLECGTELKLNFHSLYYFSVDTISGTSICHRNMSTNLGFIWVTSTQASFQKRVCLHKARTHLWKGVHG